MTPAPREAVEATPMKATAGGEALRLIALALAEVDAMVKRQWSGQHALKLTIPVDEQRDTDCIITNALLAAKAAPAGSAEAERAVVEEREKWLALFKPFGSVALDDPLDWCFCGHGGVFDSTEDSGHARECRAFRAALRAAHAQPGDQR